MTNSVKINHQQEQSTSKWSGGTTTQLAIYPENSLYGERNFLWRISTAIVEDEESVFTSLPGYERFLMVLEGQLELNHEAHYSKTLHPYEMDTFSGHWKTTSYGKVKDFNLIFNASCSGAMNVLRVNPKVTVNADKPQIVNTAEHVAVCIYIYKGSLMLDVPGQDSSYPLIQNDFAVITIAPTETISAVKLTNVANEEAVAIQTTVIY